MITSLFAALLGLMYLLLNAYVVSSRFNNKVGIGDGDNAKMQVAIRMHGNFIENVPFVLILMYLAETQYVADWILFTSGIVLVVTRALHAWGLYTTTGPSWQRMLGMIGCYGIVLVLSILLILNFLNRPELI